ncbi:MAG: flagellar basal-body rod protein FlgC [Phenylobacterium sp.]|jgi:flagellar basal-body rod protein FlgC
MATPEIYAINLFGMGYERARLEAAALNIANANIISASKEGGFKPVGVTVDQLPTAFADYLQMADAVHISAKPGPTSQAIFKPDHPLAGNDGFVFSAKVNLAAEMITLNSATRAYEANVKAFNTYKEMAAKAMEIGK